MRFCHRSGLLTLLLMSWFWALDSSLEFGCGHQEAPKLQEIPSKFPVPLHVWGEDNPSAEVLIRTTSAVPHLKAYLEDLTLPSLRLFWKGSIVVVLDDTEAAYGQSLAQRAPYPRVVLEHWNRTETFSDSQKTAQKARRNGKVRLLPRGSGYVVQAFSNMWCDLQSQADLVLVMDTDSAMLTPQSSSLYLHNNTIPMVIGTQAGPTESGYGDMSRATRKLLGIKQFGNFMFGFPLLVPRQAFQATRCQIQKAHPDRSLFGAWEMMASSSFTFYHFSMLLTALHHRSPATALWHLADTAKGTTKSAGSIGAHMRRIPTRYVPDLLLRSYCATVTIIRHLRVESTPHVRCSVDDLMDHPSNNSSLDDINLAESRNFELIASVISWDSPWPVEVKRRELERHFAFLSQSNWTFDISFLNSLRTAASKAKSSPEHSIKKCLHKYNWRYQGGLGLENFILKGGQSAS